MSHPLPPRLPAEVAAVAAALREQGQCCPHPKGAHGPDGGCRMCAAGRTTSCSGWTPAWSFVASGAESNAHLFGIASGAASNAHLFGAEDSGRLPCSTEGCGHHAIQHHEDRSSPTGLGGCRSCGNCGAWTYVIAGSEEDLLRRAGAIAGTVAEAIGASTTDEETAHRTVAALREHRADVLAILDVTYADEAATAAELLRQVLMDYGPPPCPPACCCSAARAQAFLAARGVQVESS